MKPYIGKLLIGLNYSVGMVIVAAYTLKIDISSIEPHIDSWLLLSILCVLTTLLLGTPLWIITEITIAISSKSTDALLDHESLKVSRSSFDSIGISAAYTMLLYLLGLTDSFFSFMVFYS